MAGSGVAVEIDLVWEHRVAAPRLPVAWLSDEEKAAELQRVQQRRAQDTAYEAELILGLAGQRPAGADPQPGSPGARKPGWSAGEPAAGISEFFTAELSAILNLGRGTADAKLARALTWSQRLPATFAALRSGELDERRACALADELMHTRAGIAEQVETALLGEASDLSVYKLRDRAAELVLQLDAAADERRAEAAKTADVHLYPAGIEGRSVVTADLPTDESVECFDVVDQLAKMLKADGDDRPIGAIRAHVLSLLIRRPADHGLPNVRANVTVTAALNALEGASSTPGEVNGLPITAGHLRELLARVGALGLTAPDGGTLTFAVTGPDGELLATLTPAELTRLTKRDCPVRPPCRGPPRACERWGARGSFDDRQRAFVTTRDRRCRFPNCGQRVGWADLDHVIAHRPPCRVPPRARERWGARGSFDFAPGWQFRMDDNGTLHVTTPSGVTRTTRPPGLAPVQGPAASLRVVGGTGVLHPPPF
jgi:hypothetical protein